MIKYQYILLSFLLIAPSCSAKTKLVYRSAKKRPKWVIKQPEDQYNLYFLGIKTDALTLEEARKLATQDAVKGVVDFFGIKAKTRYESTRSELSNQIIDQIEAKGKAKVSGAALEEMYYEEWRDDVRGTRWNVYILLRYPKQEIKREKARLEEENRKIIRKARSALNLGKQKEKEGEITVSLKNYADALKDLEEAEGGLSLQQEILNQTRSLLANLKLETLPYPKVADTREGITLKAKVTYLEKNVSGLTVMFRFLEGRGILDHEVITDSQGIASCIVRRMFRAKERNLVEASASTEGLPSSARTTFSFASKGEPAKIWSKRYSLKFGQKREKLNIGLYKAKEVKGLINISLSGPGRTEEIIFEVSPVKGKLFIQPEEEIQVEDIEIKAGKKRLSILAEDAKLGEEIETTISPFCFKAKVLKARKKQYSTTYTGPFLGIEKIDLEVAIYYE